VTGTACTGTSQQVTCGDNGEGCIVITGTTDCAAPRTCQGALPTGACTCPATPPAGCERGPGASCQSDTSIATCAGDNTTDCYHLVAGSCGTTTNGQTRFCKRDFPNATCTDGTMAGWYDDLGSAGNRSKDILFGHPITIGETVTLRRFGLIVRSGTTHAQIAFYADTGGVPTGGPVAYVSGVLLNPGRNEFAPTSPASTPTLTAGTYWIMMAFEAQISLAQDAQVSAPRQLASCTYGGGFPNPIAAASSPSAQSNYYVLVTTP
jgi:hypothetical protein